MNNSLSPFDGIIQIAVLAMVMAIALDLIFSFGGKSKFPTTKLLTRGLIVGSLQTVRGLAWVAGSVLDHIGSWLVQAARTMAANPGWRTVAGYVGLAIGLVIWGAGQGLLLLQGGIRQILRAKPATHGHSGGHHAHP